MPEVVDVDVQEIEARMGHDAFRSLDRIVDVASGLEALTGKRVSPEGALVAAATLAAGGGWRTYLNGGEMGDVEVVVAQVALPALLDALETRMMDETQYQLGLRDAIRDHVSAAWYAVAASQ